MGRPYKIKRHKQIYRRSTGSVVLRVLVIVVAIAALFALGWALYAPVSNWIAQRQNQTPQQTIGSSDEQQSQEEMVPGTSQTEEDLPQAEEQPVSSTSAMTAYLPPETVQDSAAFSSALTAAKDAGYDSILIDLKTDDGTVTYSIQYNETTDARVTTTTPIDLASTVQQIRDAGLMPVASIHTFRDHLYPSVDHDAATWYLDSSSLWLDNSPDNGGRVWMNPFSDAAQNYIQKIVDDACNAGFEEIILQDVQFPEGYSLDMIDYFEHAGDDKHAFLQQYIAQMTEYAAGKGVELTALFPATSMLGGESDMYFGDTTDLVSGTVAIDLRDSVFGTGLQNDQISIPDPGADPYNTVRTAAAALREKLPNTQISALLDADGVAERTEAAAQSDIVRYIVYSPTF